MISGKAFLRFFYYQRKQDCEERTGPDVGYVALWVTDEKLWSILKGQCEMTLINLFIFLKLIQVALWRTHFERHQKSRRLVMRFYFTVHVHNNVPLPQITLNNQSNLLLLHPIAAT